MTGIVCFWDRPATPYLEKYEYLLRQENEPYEVLFWNRELAQVRKSDGELYLNLPCRNGKVRKLFDFFRWRRQVLRILRQRHYDRLIVLTTVPAVLLQGFLLRRYRNAYLFDIRDYTLEGNRIFSAMVNRLVANSALTAISSEAFRRWLKPSPKLHTNHNITCREAVQPPRAYFKNPILNLTQVGNIRLTTQARMALSAMKNNDRWRSCFVGRIMPNCDILDYCQREHIDNVQFSGTFSTAEKPKIFQQVDLINAIYAQKPEGEDSPAVTTVLPNRLYDALVFRVPLVCNKGTCLQKLVEQYQLGFAVDAFHDDLPACFDRYVADFEEDKFLQGCQALLSRCLQEEDAFCARVRAFVRGDAV